MESYCNNGRDRCDDELTDRSCAWEKTGESSFGGSCPFCELFIAVLKNNEVAKKDLTMLWLHLDKEFSHLRVDV